MKEDKTVSTELPNDGEILIISDAQAQFLEEILITDKPASPKLKSAMQLYMDITEASPELLTDIINAHIT